MGLALRAVAAGDAVLPGAGALGDDVDDAVEGVGAVEGGARPAHDLDAVDVLDADRQRLPEGGAEEIDVDAAAGFLQGLHGGLEAGFGAVKSGIAGLAKVEAVIDVVNNTLIPNAKNEELKALIVKVRPAFVAHLEQAKQIQAKLAQPGLVK